MHYILFYTTVENYIEKRAPFRDEHLSLVNKAHNEGSIVMAGALTNPPDGAILIFQGEDPSAAENFARNDPYVKNGIIKEWHIREWIVVT